MSALLQVVIHARATENASIYLEHTNVPAHQVLQPNTVNPVGWFPCFLTYHVLSATLRTNYQESSILF